MHIKFINLAYSVSNKGCQVVNRLAFCDAAGWDNDLEMLVKQSDESNQRKGVPFWQGTERFVARDRSRTLLKQFIQENEEV